MDLKRSDFLPAYDDEGVRLIVSEMNEIHNKLEEIMKNEADADDIDSFQQSVKPTMFYYHECLCRNNRYLNRYLNSGTTYFMG